MQQLGFKEEMEEGREGEQVSVRAGNRERERMGRNSRQKKKSPAASFHGSPRQPLLFVPFREFHIICVQTEFIVRRDGIDSINEDRAGLDGVSAESRYRRWVGGESARLEVIAPLFCSQTAI